MHEGTNETTWNVEAVRRLDSLFQFIERAIAHALETDRILATAPMR